MNNAMNIVKFIGSWFFIVAAIVVMVLDHGSAGQVLPFAAMSVAFSLAPAGA